MPAHAREPAPQGSCTRPLLRQHLDGELHVAVRDLEHLHGARLVEAHVDQLLYLLTEHAGARAGRGGAPRGRRGPRRGGRRHGPELGPAARPSAHAAHSHVPAAIGVHPRHRRRKRQPRRRLQEGGGGGRVARGDGAAEGRKAVGAGGVVEGEPRRVAASEVDEEVEVRHHLELARRAECLVVRGLQQRPQRRLVLRLQDAVLHGEPHAQHRVRLLREGGAIDADDEVVHGEVGRALPRRVRHAIAELGHVLVKNGGHVSLGRGERHADLFRRSCVLQDSLCSLQVHPLLRDLIGHVVELVLFVA
mmetsp:Transcript_55549/g.146516  ORF Transcript_55549/g.146516 Transcript_55549/m.146516 type:complete len:305 (+) Transcript_55549:336-1250(+)